MISFLEGIFHRLDDDDDNAVVVDCCGVGYAVVVSDRDRTALTAAGLDRPIRLEVRALYREDSQALFGFCSLDDRMFFDAVIRVSGFGPGVAMSVLSRMTALDAFARIRTGDPARFGNLHGIGDKTAAKLVVAVKVPESVRVILNAMPPLAPLPPKPPKKPKAVKGPW